MTVHQLKGAPAPIPSDPLARLEHWIKNPPENSRVVRYTPTMCQHIIDIYNGPSSGNRSKKPAKIREFSADMIDGLWKITGDTIKFSSTPTLIDGQNRILSCIKSKKPFVSHTVFGIDPTIFPWLDRGKLRSSGDAFYIDGVEKPNEVARVVRWLEMIRTNTVKKRTKLLPHEAIEAYKAYDAVTIGEVVKRAYAIHNNSSDNITSRSEVATLLYVAFKQDPTLAGKFAEAWANGNYAGRMAPLKKANKVLKKMRKDAGTARMNEVVRFAVWARAWLLVVANKAGTVPALQWSLKEPFPIKGL